MSNARPPSYVQTSLPVLLDLQNRGTRDQIASGVSRTTAITEANAARDSKSECEQIMVDTCREFAERHGIAVNGVRPSREEDYKRFWEWVREFHKEYNEEWFMRNMPRLKTEFQPIWSRTLKAMLAEAGSPGGGGAVISPQVDLLGTTGASMSSSALPSAAVSGLNAQPAATTTASPVDDLLGLSTTNAINKRQTNDDLLGDLLGPQKTTTGELPSDLLLHQNSGAASSTLTSNTDLLGDAFASKPTLINKNASPLDDLLGGTPTTTSAPSQPAKGTAATSNDPFADLLGPSPTTAPAINNNKPVDPFSQNNNMMINQNQIILTDNSPSKAVDSTGLNSMFSDMKLEKSPPRSDSKPKKDPFDGLLDGL